MTIYGLTSWKLKGASKELFLFSKRFQRFNITLNTGPYYPHSTVCQGGVGTAEKPCFNGQEILTIYIEDTGCAPAFLPPVL